ncbi:MAG: CHC2 zinc finger domain-containing protein [Tahibacter sp.]
MNYSTKKKPGGHRAFAGHQSGQGWQSEYSALYGKPAPRLPVNWRDRLPSPADYYAKNVERISGPNHSGWAQGACPFHTDRNASLSVDVAHDRGAWRCFAGCGGGDLLGYHMKLRGLDFVAAVRDLIGSSS